MSKKIIILCCGLPGSGKTSFCHNIANSLGSVPLLSTDIIKAIYEDTGEPILKYVSHSAWKYYGEFSKDNVIKGYSLFAKTLFNHTLEVAKKIMKTYDLLIIEGMAVTPKSVEEVSKIAKPVLIYMSSSNIQDSYKNKLQFRADKRNHWEEKSHILEIIKQQIESELDVYKPDYKIRGIQDSKIIRNQLIAKLKNIYNY